MSPQLPVAFAAGCAGPVPAALPFGQANIIRALRMR
ncbi:hypothetical protein ABID94_002764 [Streptomyces sp. PvR018]|nr:hypothetical protein JHY03_30590 [Streptomyces sp. CA-256286]